MKKLLKIIYLLLIPLYSTFGQGLIGVSILDTNMVVGDTIFVPVYVDSTLTGENVSSYNLQFSFNDYYFVVDSAYSDGTLTAGWGSVSYNTNTEDRISVAAAGSTDLSGTGILLYLRVRAIRSGNSNLSFTDTTYNFFNEGSPRVVLDYGRISITAKPTIRVNPNSELLTTGDTHQFTVSYGTAPYLWSLTDGSVASIDTDGLLTAISKGTTKVVAQDANGIIDTSDGVVEIRAFELSTRDTSQYQGQIVDIPIFTTDLTGLNYTAGEFTLELNQTILTPLEIITTGTILSGYTTPSFGFNNGILKIAFAGDTPLAGSGVLMIVRYQITSENSNNTYIEFTDILFNETDMGNGVRSYFDTLPLATLTISPSTGSLLAGETLQFAASNGTSPYTWSVSNSTLAFIDNAGLLTATKGGVIKVLAEDTFGGSGSSGDISLYDTEVRIPDTTTEIGTTIDIPIHMASLASSNSIVALQTNILFDSSKVKFDQVVTTGTSTDGWSFSANDLGNKVTIAGANTSGFNSAGVILNLRFNVSPNVSVGNYTNVSLENFLFNEGSPNARTANGKITIATTSVPVAPSGLVALSTSNTQINLMWTDNSNNESGFKIERKIGSAGTWGQIATVSQNITTYNNSGLALGTDYYYRVRAYNSLGDSDYSNEANASTSDGTPNAPTDLGAILDAVDSSGTIYISWQDNSTDETGFTLELSINTSSAWNILSSLGTNETFYADSNLVDGTEYFYRVLAFNGNGNSAYSNVGSEITIMNSPTNLGATNPQNKRVVLTWEDNSSSESGYIIERQDGVNLPAPNFVAIHTTLANEITFTDSNFTTEVNYIYRVRGFNAKTQSTYSNEEVIQLTDLVFGNEIPTQFDLSQNYPNPFNPSTMIRFSVPEASFANITIYNLLGEKVENLLNKNVSAGFYEKTWNAENVPSGIYLISVRFESNVSHQTHSFTKKAILLK